MYITPITDQVIVELDHEEAKTTGGVHLPEEHRVRPVWGCVLASGPGRVSRKNKLIPNQTTAGDRVCVEWKSGQDLIIGGRDVKIVRDHEILAIEASE